MALQLRPQLFISDKPMKTYYFELMNSRLLSLPKELLVSGNECRNHPSWPLAVADPVCIVRRGEENLLETCVVPLCARNRECFVLWLRTKAEGTLVLPKSNLKFKSLTKIEQAS